MKVQPYYIFRSNPNQMFEKRSGSFYNDSLSTVFWKPEKNQEGSFTWVFDQRVRQKLIRIAEDFFKEFKGVLGNLEIEDIQLTGSLANFNYTDLSDLDVQIVVDLKEITDENSKVLKSALDGIRFKWNLSHDISIRGYDVEMYIHDFRTPHEESALFSLLSNKWIKSPVFDPPQIDSRDVLQKYDVIVSEYENLHSKLISLSTLPDNAKDLYRRALKLKEKVIKMRKEGIDKGGENSIGNLVYKKLRNERYIEKIIDLISEAYSKIYDEK